MENLIALRNAIDAILEGRPDNKKPSVKRLTKKEQLIEKHRQWFFRTINKVKTNDK